MHDVKDVDIAAKGNWEDVIRGLLHIDSKVLSGKHQPCPCCGGRDRFRWIKKSEVGFCQHCGNNGIIPPLYLIQRLGGYSFSDAVNSVGDYLNMIPVQRKKANIAKAAVSNVSSIANNKANPKGAAALVKAAMKAPFSKLTLDKGIAAEGFLLYKEGLIVTMHEIGGELVNAAHVSESGVKYAANGVTYGSFHLIGSDTGKSAIICIDYFDAHYVNAATGCQVICVMDLYNASVAAFQLKELEQYKGRLLIACNVDSEELTQAERADLPVLLPKGGERISYTQSVIKRKFNAEDLLNKMEL